MDAFKEIIKTKLLPIFLGNVVVCSNSDCRDWVPASATTHPNPRFRWFVDVYIGDDDENARVNLCPKCIKEFFSLEEKDYKDLERSEKLATGKLTPSQFYQQVSGKN